MIVKTVLYIVLYYALHHQTPFCNVRKAASLIALCRLQARSRPLVAGYLQ